MRTLLVLLAFVALLLSGCGSASAPGPSTSQPPVGGEKSIEDFGEEAAGESRAAILAAFGGYLLAIARDEQTDACTHLARGARLSLRKLAGPSDNGPTCQETLTKLLAPTAAALAAEQSHGRVIGVRVEGDRAFVVFHAPGARLYQMPMVREGRKWAVGILAPSILVPSAASFGR